MKTDQNEHQVDYKPSSWKEYTFMELGNWIHNLAKRAAHRSNKEKRDKDLYDAQNYLNMMQEKLDSYVAQYE